MTVLPGPYILSTHAPHEIRFSNSCGTGGGHRANFVAGLPPRAASATPSTSSSSSYGDRKRTRTGTMDGETAYPSGKQPRHNRSRNSDRDSVDCIPTPNTPITPNDRLRRGTSSCSTVYGSSDCGSDDVSEEVAMDTDTTALSAKVQQALGIGEEDRARVLGLRPVSDKTYSDVEARGDRVVRVGTDIASALECAPVIPRHPSPEVDEGMEDLASSKKAYRASVPNFAAEKDVHRGTGRRKAPPPAYAAFQSAEDREAQDGIREHRRASIAGISTRDSAQNIRPHVRLEAANVPRPPLSVVFRNPAERMVAVSVVAIESIWKCPPPPEVEGVNGRRRLYPAEQHLPLDEFVRETIRRSRTSIPVHQLALVYLHRARHRIHERVLEICKAAERLQQLISPACAPRTRDGAMTPPNSPPRTKEAADLWRACNDPIGDGRKMFLAALMCAWKFAQDSNYSNKAWSKITGLDVSKVSENERLFLSIVEFNLNVAPDYFNTWIARLDKLAADMVAREASAPISPVSPQDLPQDDASFARRSSIARSNTEYPPAPALEETKAGGPSPAKPHVRVSMVPKCGSAPNMERRTSHVLPSPQSSPDEEISRRSDFFRDDGIAKVLARPIPGRRNAIAAPGGGIGQRTFSSGSIPNFPMARALSQGIMNIGPTHGGYPHLGHTMSGSRYVNYAS